MRRVAIPPNLKRIGYPCHIYMNYTIPEQQETLRRIESSIDTLVELLNEEFDSQQAKGIIRDIMEEQVYYHELTSGGWYRE